MSGVRLQKIKWTGRGPKHSTHMQWVGGYRLELSVWETRYGWNWTAALYRKEDGLDELVLTERESGRSAAREGARAEAEASAPRLLKAVGVEL